MKKRFLCFTLLFALILGACGTVASAQGLEAVIEPQSQSAWELSFLATDRTLETDESFPADLYYYSQLNSDGKQIYDALAHADNLEKLKAGESVTVGMPYVLDIPAGVKQAEYNEMVAAFRAESERLGTVLKQMSNAAAAFDRDRSDIFWTGGVSAATLITVNGEPSTSSVSLSPGNLYTLSLQIRLPLLPDWDGEGTDRDLDADISRLQDGIERLALEAEEAATHRYGRLEYINERLCYYNAYNSAAASAGGSQSYGSGLPWSALAALDQLTAAEDANGSLKPVCEGYARALKLLCDRLEIPCILVSGSGDGEEHMWNYVQMEDGAWYAMDVTWNDSTTRNGYFLVGKDVMDQKHTTHNRFMASGQTAEFLYPVLSAQSYDPNQLTLHASQNELMGGGEVTLTVGGALDRSKVTVSCEGDCTLTDNGDGTYLVLLPNATASYRFTARYTGLDAYFGLSATCDVAVTQHTHLYGEWVVTKNPTEQQTGTREKSCACGHTVSEEIPVLTHEYESKVTPPDCTQDGYTTHTCKHCGESYVDSHTDSLGHDYGDDGVCSRCGIRQSQESDETQAGDTQQADTKPVEDEGESDGESLASMFGCSSATGSVSVLALIGLAGWFCRKKR